MQALIDNYVNWLRQRTSFTKVDDNWFEINTPFLNSHNDCIQIYARPQGGSIYLTDAGETIHDLELSGVSFDRSDKRKKELSVILNGFGIKLNESNELFATATEVNFAQVKHRLLQAILSVGDMFMLAETKTESFFFEDVRAFLDDQDIPSISNTQFLGKSGFTHNFDFSIPKSKQNPERLVKLLNYPRKDLLEQALWAYEDTRQVRENTKGVVILNDETKAVAQDFFAALSSYDLIGIKWSERLQHIDALK